MTIAITTSIQIIIAHLTQTTHKCKSHNNNDKVNEVINSKCTSNNTPSETKASEEHSDSDSSDSIPHSPLDLEWLSDKIIKVKLNNEKYAANYPVTINKNNTISLCDTGATISCMPKACFEKLDPKPTLIQKHTYKINGANGNSLGPIGTTTCTLEFPKKFQQHFIVYEHLLWPIILGLDFLHNYPVGINWFSTKQLYLHWVPWSIVVLDPTPFPLHISQISTLLWPHLLVKTISQVTVPSRTLAIVPTTITSPPKPDCYYNLTGTWSTSNQIYLLYLFLKYFVLNYQCTFCVQS